MSSPYSSYGTPPPDPSPPPAGPTHSVAFKQPPTKPVVTYTMIGICVAVYLLQLASQNLYQVDLPVIFGAKINEMILKGQLWRFITPMFLHGSIMHVGFNMYALFNIGPGLERFYGHKRFLALYLLAGFAGNVVSFILTPSVSVGSSTAIFGLLGAEGVFMYVNREIFGQNARRGLTQVISIAAVNLIIGLSPGIDNWGHVGGLIGGTLFAWFAGPKLGVEGIFPNFALVDQRDGRSVLLAGTFVGGLFAIVALVTILIRL
jgi:rhomboid protease GluP